jgi:hypothetical protein
MSLIVLATPSDTKIETIVSSDSPPKNSPPKGAISVDEADFQTLGGRRSRMRSMFITPFVHLLYGKQEKEAKKIHAKKTSVTYNLDGTRVKRDSGSVGPDKEWRRGEIHVDILDRRHGKPQPDQSDSWSSMIVVNKRNFVGIILKWGAILTFRIFGFTSVPGLDKSMRLFADHLLGIYIHNGVQEVIVRLKIYLHVLLAYTAEKQMVSTKSLGRRVRVSNGLPSCLSAATRHAIRSKSIQSIRFWTSILGMYKGLRGVWDYPSYSSIQSAPLEESGNTTLRDFGDFCQNIFLGLMKGFPKLGNGLLRETPIPVSILRTKDTYISSKSGPNGKSFSDLHWDLVAWLVLAGHELGYFTSRPKITIIPKAGTLKDSLESPSHPFKEFIDFCIINYVKVIKLCPWAVWAHMTGDVLFWTVTVKALLNELKSLDLTKIAISPGNPITSSRDTRSDVDPWKQDDSTNDPKWAARSTDGGLQTACLVSLYEAAGKVRNIVKFDWFTQHVLQPLHDFLFVILREIPTDATFDQQAAVDEFSKRDYKYIASYDLKAATELISLVLYKCVLTPIIGKRLADQWAKLLSDRDIQVADDAPVGKTGTHIRYTRGQPMGALSSWAAMSLVHHAIVQFAAYRVRARHIDQATTLNINKFDKFNWFIHYLVLGDDIVIADQLIADEYVYICGKLGIIIGLPKSFESTESFFNFAGQSFLARHNISPISFKEELSCRTPGNRLEMAVRLASRGVLDFSSSGWLPALLRAVLPKSVNKRILGYLHEGKGVHHAVKTVLVIAFGTLDRFARLGRETQLGSTLRYQGLSVNGYFHLTSGLVSMFSESLEQIQARVGEDMNDETQEAALAWIAHRAFRLTRRFRNLHPLLLKVKALGTFGSEDRLKNPQTFLPDTLTHIGPVLWSYPTLGKRCKELQSWYETYWSFLLTFTVAYSLQPDLSSSDIVNRVRKLPVTEATLLSRKIDNTMNMTQLQIVEVMTRLSLDRIIIKLTEAEEEFPLDFQLLKESTDKITRQRSPDEIYRLVEQRFSMWAAIMEVRQASRLNSPTPALSMPNQESN